MLTSAGCGDVVTWILIRASRRKVRLPETRCRDQVKRSVELNSRKSVNTNTRRVLMGGWRRMEKSYVISSFQELERNK
jgi:hypothetical protein